MKRTPLARRSAPKPARKPMKQQSDKRRQTKTPLRKAAAGQECTLRIPGVCRRDPDYTVSAHIRLPGNSGMSLKPLDLFAVDACDQCHEIQEHKNKWADAALGWDDIVRAIVETQTRRYEEGLIRLGPKEKEDTHD